MKELIKSLLGRKEELSHFNQTISELKKQNFFKEELGWFLQVDSPWLKEATEEFFSCEDGWRTLCKFKSSSQKTDGIAKTLDIAEGFALWCFVKYYKPKVVVELGSQFGLSARLWKEALNIYVKEHELYLCDLDDRRKYISDEECTFLKGDARETLKGLLHDKKIDVLINDAHPYDLIMWSLHAGVEANIPHFAFHDIGHHHPRGVYRKEFYDLPEETKMKETANWAEYGCWERHGMAKVFDERIAELNTAENDDYKIQIFDSLFGYGFVTNKKFVKA